MESETPYSIPFLASHCAYLARAVSEEVKADGEVEAKHPGDGQERKEPPPAAASRAHEAVGLCV